MKYSKPSKSISIHPSQFPAAVRRDLTTSLRARVINHKFHYDSVKQATRWLALHEACSPARHDLTCQDSYTQAFAKAARLVIQPAVHLIGLGCGGGRKEAALLEILQHEGKRLSYSPVDVSVALVLAATAATEDVIGTDRIHPLVCDLQTSSDLAEVFDVGENPLSGGLEPKTQTIFTFFGLIPNFEPELILPKLAELVGPADLLLFSANLAPGDDYAAAVAQILPQYDNPLTREWLMTLLCDLGIEAGDGELRFSIEEGGFALKRIVARFHFTRARRIEVYGETVEFDITDSLQVFFSYRYQVGQVQQCLGRYGLAVREVFLNANGEEGVFLVQTQQ